jgi:hypothetical protein
VTLLAVGLLLILLSVGLARVRGLADEAHEGAAHG